MRDQAKRVEERATDLSRAASVNALLQEVAAECHIPSIALAVADPTRVLFTGAVGWADLAEGRAATPDDQFLWFSMTKIATATAAMRLHVEGALDLHAPIGTYLPGYRGDRTHGHPTTRQLLSHTAGLRNPLPVRWVRPEGEPADAELESRVVTRHGTPRRAVGGRAGYSNIGYLLAGAVLEAVTGQPVEDCVRDLVLIPLGMTSTDFHYRPGAPRAVGYVRNPRSLGPVLRGFFPDGIVGPRAGRYTSFQPFLVNGSAYGGLVGPVSDAARLAAMHVAGPEDPHPVLDQGAITEMRTVTAKGKPFDHGIGWFRKPVDSTRTPAFVEHYGTGGGFWNAMRIYPERRLAFVAMANTTAAWDVDNLFSQLVAGCWPLDG